ncbi:MAG: cytochrome c biogenesis protein CcdA [Fibrobacter sp.]|nr:cytochrome c biogenesis protein CcdA [Fibrobacter sp.]
MGENISILLVFAAGLTSVFSPCVLPVIPIVVAGKADDHRLRPILIVAGLATTFILMGVVSSLFGAAIGPKMVYVEKIAGFFIILFGLLFMLNVNLFKYLGFISQFASRSRGNLSGYFLGFTLGIVWIPCVGPMLSSVLATVASDGKLLNGVFLLLIYSAGFAVPMLIAGYASQFFRTHIKAAGKYPRVINVVSGLVLILLGGIITFKGMTFFGF